MKVTVIGCSPAWANPGGVQSGYLVDNRLLIDCGPGVLAQLRLREPWPSIDAIVLTHLHLDHTADITAWLWGALMGPGRGKPQPELWLPPGGLAELARLGVAKIFTPGAPTTEIVAWVNKTLGPRRAA